jgi:hypothetical protein
MSDPISLSKPYQSRNDAAIGGFKRVLMNSKEWETKEFAFWVILKVNAKKVPEYFYTAPESDSWTSRASAARLSARCETKDAVRTFGSRVLPHTPEVNQHGKLQLGRPARL